MGFTSDACWFLLIKNKKREAALKNEAGGDNKHGSFLLGPYRPFIQCRVSFSKLNW